MLTYRCEDDRSSATDLLFKQVPLPSYKQTPLDDLGCFATNFLADPLPSSSFPDIITPMKLDFPESADPAIATAVFVL